MIITGFRLLTFVKELLWNLRRITDYTAMHPVREIQRAALEETIRYIRQNMPTATGFTTSRQILEYALQQVEVEGHYLEFGVYKGGTIRFIAKHISDKVIHGFDSFEGLPKDFSGHYYYDKNAFNLHGKLPRVPANVQLHPGWFDQALPKWLDTHPGPVAFVHIDCDLYSSTKTVFELLASRIQPRTIVVFDEYFNYANWQNQEFKAFQEFVKEYDIVYDYMAYARHQVAVKIKSIGWSQGGTK